MRRLNKLLTILTSKHWASIRALSKGVPAGVEHRNVLQPLHCRTVVDIGANRGQFALAARRRWPTARLISFEPLQGPARQFRKVFDRDELVVLHVAAIGPDERIGTMHVSRRDDSSSLLAITSMQDAIFPGTDEVGTVDVKVAPLSRFLDAEDLATPALLKIDVQGFELQVLQGCEELLTAFEWLYCECSFIELYEGQALAGTVIEWLAERGYTLAGVSNAVHHRDGRAVQCDLLFRRRDIDAIPHSTPGT